MNTNEAARRIGLRSRDIVAMIRNGRLRAIQHPLTGRFEISEEDFAICDAWYQHFRNLGFPRHPGRVLAAYYTDELPGAFEPPNLYGFGTEPGPDWGNALTEFLQHYRKEEP